MGKSFFTAVPHRVTNRCVRFVAGWGKMLHLTEEDLTGTKGPPEGRSLNAEDTMRHSLMRELVLLAGVVALSITPSSCKRSPREGPGESLPRSILFMMHLVSQREGDCGAGSGCAYVTLEFPEIQKESASPVADSVRGAVWTFILAPVLGGTRADSIGALTAQFIGSFKEAQRRFPGRTQWDLKRRAAIVRDSAGIITLELREFIFTGGAHPTTALGYANFDARTGKRLRLSDIVIEGKGEDLLVVAERQFRLQKNIPAGMGLEEAGYRFKEGRFALNENFSLAGDTLLFYYNPTEIAPYAMGSTTVRIPAALARNFVHY